MSKDRLPNPLIPLILLLTIVILITIIVINMTQSQQQDPMGKTVPEPESPQTISPFPARSWSSGNAVKNGIPDTGALIRQALEKWRQGDIEGAEQDLRTVLVFDRDNPTALSHLGTLLYHQGDFSGAEYLFRRQTISYPANPVGFRNLALTLFRENRLQEAIDEMKRAYALKPSDGESALMLARFYAYAGDKWSAIAYLQRARQAKVPLADVVEEPVFNLLRTEPAFQELVQELASPKGTGQ